MAEFSATSQEHVNLFIGYRTPSCGFMLCALSVKKTFHFAQELVQKP